MPGCDDSPLPPWLGEPDWLVGWDAAGWDAESCFFC
jgi:hypothetical protein